MDEHKAGSILRALIRNNEIIVGALKRADIFSSEDLVGIEANADRIKLATLQLEGRLFGQQDHDAP